MLHQNWFCGDNMILVDDGYGVQIFYDTDSHCFYVLEEIDYGISIHEYPYDIEDDSVYKNFMEEYGSVILSEILKKSFES